MDETYIIGSGYLSENIQKKINNSKIYSDKNYHKQIKQNKYNRTDNHNNPTHVIDINSSIDEKCVSPKINIVSIPNGDLNMSIYC